MFKEQKFLADKFLNLFKGWAVTEPSTPVDLKNSMLEVSLLLNLSSIDRVRYLRANYLTSDSLSKSPLVRFNL